MKFKIIFAYLLLGIIIISGCTTNKQPNTTQEQQKQENQQKQNDTEPNAITTASIVNDEEAFLKAVSSEGTWIIAVLRDMTIEEDIVLEGEFIHNDKPERKIALYSQDENRNITARYTLTAPRLIVKSENARIQNGTFVGDIYVEANNFSLVDTKVEGNLYFSSEEYKASSNIDEKSSITGVIEIKQP